MTAVVVAGAVRLQALILLPTFALAALAHARMTRSGATLRRLAAAARRRSPVLGAVAGGSSRRSARCLVGGRPRRVRHPRRGVRSCRPASLEEVVWHVAGLAVVTVGIPLLATAVLVGAALRHGEDDARAASFLATTGRLRPAARRAGGRVRVPVTSTTSRSATCSPRRRRCFLGLLLWVERGAPRPASACSRACGALLLAALLVVPARPHRAPPGRPGRVLLGHARRPRGRRLAHGWVRACLVAAGVVAVALVALAPRRAGRGASWRSWRPVSLVQAVVATREIESASAARAAQGDRRRLALVARRVPTPRA